MIVFLNLDSSLNISIQPSGLSQNTVGQKQYVICSIPVPPDMDPGMVELAWLNEEDIITADSRVTIANSTKDLANSSTDFSMNLVSRIIQFNPLFEIDEGIYYCYSSINGSLQFASIQLQDFKSTYEIYKYIAYMYIYVCTYCSYIQSRNLSTWIMYVCTYVCIYVYSTYASYVQVTLFMCLY